MILQQNMPKFNHWNWRYPTPMPPLTVTRPRVSVHELYTEIQRTTGVHVSLVAWYTICNWENQYIYGRIN